MGIYSLSSPSRHAGQGRRQTPTRRAFQCPALDTEGSPLAAQDSVIGPDDDPQTLVSCTYDDGEDPCLYSPDGSLEEGPSTCLQCPAQDTEGSPLEALQSVMIIGQNGDTQTLASCTYEDGEPPCLYSPDGSLEEGPSTCIQCPAQDIKGSPLEALDSVTITGQNGDPQTLASCTYEDEEDPCLYWPGGSLEEGPSTCPTADSSVTFSMTVSPSRPSDTSRITSTKQSTMTSSIILGDVRNYPLCPKQFKEPSCYWFSRVHRGHRRGWSAPAAAWPAAWLSSEPM
ncbi:hypothetical protein FB451DRAFT_189802 [Mycena latifolia]|nr:hypothetical protein FB451DRAFT_189802 [Mycena latifolia]